MTLKNRIVKELDKEIEFINKGRTKIKLKGLCFSRGGERLEHLTNQIKGLKRAIKIIERVK